MENKIKIFFVIKSIHAAAGTERATINISNELSKRGYQIGIVSLVDEGVPFFPLEDDVKIFYLKNASNSLVRDFSRRKQLKNLYQRENPDIVIFVGSGRSMLNIPSAKGIKKVTWEHFNASINWHLLHPLSKKLAAKFCDKIITLTEQDAKNYQKKYGAKNTVCIPNPITIDNSEKSPLTEKTVLAIGRFSEQKGFDMLIDSWQKIAKNVENWTLRIIGEGKMKSFLEDKINKYGLQSSVELLPPTNNVIEEYKRASIYVMSSRFEGLPLVLIEAMAMGLPIVSFDCETGPAEVIEHEKTGIIVPFKDTENLSIELLELMNDKEKRAFFSQNAIVRAENFTVEKIMPLWEKMISELLTSK